MYLEYYKYTYPILSSKLKKNINYRKLKLIIHKVLNCTQQLQIKTKIAIF